MIIHQQPLRSRLAAASAAAQLSTTQINCAFTRDGQSQFSAALALQASDRRPLRELQAWILEHLGEPLDIETLAERVAMSPRNFARVFSREMGITPGKFVEALRVETARRRLEETGRSLKTISQECGFANAGAMREVFKRVLGVGPADYREHFRSARSD